MISVPGFAQVWNGTRGGEIRHPDVVNKEQQEHSLSFAGSDLPGSREWNFPIPQTEILVYFSWSFTEFYPIPCAVLS